MGDYQCGMVNGWSPFKSSQAVRARAQRAGVEMVAGQVLRGWTDRGDRFVLRLGIEGEGIESEVAAEVEQVRGGRRGGRWRRNQEVVQGWKWSHLPRWYW